MYQIVNSLGVPLPNAYFTLVAYAVDKVTPTQCVRLTREGQVPPCPSLTKPPRRRRWASGDGMPVVSEIILRNIAGDEEHDVRLVGHCLGAEEQSQADGDGLEEGRKGFEFTEVSHGKW